MQKEDVNQGGIKNRFYFSNFSFHFKQIMSRSLPYFYTYPYTTSINQTQFIPLDFQDWCWTVNTKEIDDDDPFPIKGHAPPPHFFTMGHFWIKKVAYIYWEISGIQNDKIYKNSETKSVDIFWLSVSKYCIIIFCIFLDVKWCPLWTSSEYGKKQEDDANEDTTARWGWSIAFRNVCHDFLHREVSPNKYLYNWKNV